MISAIMLARMYGAYTTLVVVRTHDFGTSLQRANVCSQTHVDLLDAEGRISRAETNIAG
jgi:hypothetical protein